MFLFIDIMFIIVPIIIIIGWIFMIALMVSPKLRSKIMARNMKSAMHARKNALKEFKDEIGEEGTDDLKDIEEWNADIKGVYVKGVAKSVAEGIGEAKTDAKEIVKVRCQYCKELNDEDAKYCKNCGRLL